MKKAVFVILDRFADWESACLSMALSGEMTDEYLVLFASEDNNPKYSIGGMTVLPDLALGDIPDGAARWLSSAGLTAGLRHTANSQRELEAYPAYNNKEGYVLQDCVRDGNVVTANGNAPVAFAAGVLRALGAAPAAKIQEFHDFYTMGYYDALQKYGYEAG